MTSLHQQLLLKYDVPLPRYTSYPTVPYWEPQTLTPDVWKQAFTHRFVAEKGQMSLYIHLPFCENLCTFCACNKRITKNHAVEEPYIAALVSEWQMYRQLMPYPPVLHEIHLGGGTPTFFSAQNLHQLLAAITHQAQVPHNHEFSVEVHPNYTRYEHLETLASIGFKRISLGVQDFDPLVQFTINRVQTFDQTKAVVDWATKLGFEGINIDLVYGLPKQQVSSVEHTVELITRLRPHRIAFYSYAHVPWKSKVQRRYTDADLPNALEKWNMYERGRQLLTQAGYKVIGMDHFALPNDKLFVAEAAGNMHRNFMGYTTTATKLLVGLGASAIGDTWEAFAQNEKEVEKYELLVSQNQLPITTGHLLTDEDLLIRKHILELMCTGKTTLQPDVLPPAFLESVFEKLQPLQADELVALTGTTLSVLPKGAIFIRNISACLDARMWRKQAQGNMFSKAI